MSAIMVALREAPWLGPDRARAWLRVLAAASTLVALVMLLATRGGNAPDPWGYALGRDFVSFWTAASLALGGATDAAWQPASHAAAERARFAADAGYRPAYYAFFYPPTFLLLLLPFGLLPYGAAVAAWLVVTGAAYVAALRQLLPAAWPRGLVALAFPGLLVNAGSGQNGALSTALLGGAALWLDRRPCLAGACLGVLSVKPQLALLVVPALVAARRWRALAFAAAAAATLAALSALVLGRAAWSGFRANAALAGQTLEMGLVGFGKMASVFAGARLLGAAPTVAWALQAAMSATVLAVVLRVASRRPGAAAEVATIAAAACLFTPFLLTYDLMLLAVLLAVPLAWVAAQAARNGYRPWEKLVLAAAFFVPLAARASLCPITPPIAAALLAVVVSRAGAASVRPA